MKPRDSFATRPASPTWFAVSARLALISLLVLLVVLGVHGHFATPIWATRSKLRDAAVAGVLEVMAVALVLALVARGRNAHPGQRVAQTLRKVLVCLLVSGALALAATSVVLVPGIPLARTAPVCPGPKCFIVYPKPGPPPGPAGSFHFPVSVLYGLAAGALLAAIVVLALSVMRRGRRPPPPELSVVAEEYGEELEAALEGGRRALLGLDDARAAIIACYVAMEDSLAQAGTTRSSAETPDELLARAASTLLVSAGAARRLTALFYEARFSSHPLDEGRRAEAESALSDLAAELSRAQAPAAGAGP